ncbi:MAG: DUF3090 family protein [Candidatus Rokuibacteriota bacterium]
MSQSFDLQGPDHFTAGAVGPSGQRVFYLQAREAGSLLTLKTEKEHVRGLAEYLEGLLAKSPVAADEVPSDLALLEPLDPAWSVGAIGVGYDETEDRIVVVVNELVGEDESEERATARLRVTRAQAAGFVARARELMQASRPTCQVCGGPIDPGGHLCPRRNGHKV